MNRKISKLNLFLIVTFILMIIILPFFTSTVHAEETGSADNVKVAVASMDDIIDDANSFLNTGDDNVIDAKELSKTIYNVLLAIGMILAVIIGIVLGIQYMTSTTEGKAQNKEKLVAYFVGCAILFGSFAIWRITINVLQGTEQDIIESSLELQQGESSEKNMVVEKVQEKI